MKYEYKELITYLENLGVNSLSTEEYVLLEAQMDRLNGNMTMIKKELVILATINKNWKSIYKEVTLSNMIHIIDNIEINSLVELYTLYNKLETKYKDESRDTIDHTFNILATDILNKVEMNTQKTSQIHLQPIEETRIKEVLYMVMSKKEADLFFEKCNERSGSFLTNCDSKNLKSIILLLKNNFNITDTELLEIAQKCTTFFISSSVGKINGIKEILEDFKNYIDIKLLIDNEKITLNNNFKEILINKSSLLEKSSRDISKTIRFLKGENLEDILSNSRTISQLKADFSSRDLAKLYNESITSLSTSLEKIVQICININSAYEKVYDKELDLTKLVNIHNFRSFNSIDKKTLENNIKIQKIIELLSEFFSAEDMENILRNRLGFLSVSINTIKKGIIESIKETDNLDSLKKSLISKIKKSFHENAGEMPDSIEYNASIKVSKLNPVNIRKLDIDSIIDILESLNVSKKDIDKVEENWKNHNPDKVELTKETLSLLLEEIMDLEEISIPTSSDHANVLEESIVIKTLYEELHNKYQKFLTVKTNSKMKKDYLEMIEKKLADIKVKVNENLNNIINFYKEKINILSNQLDSLEKKDEPRILLERNLEELIKKQAEGNLTYERLNNIEEQIEKTSDFIRIIKKNEKEKFDEMTDKIFPLYDELLRCARDNNYKVATSTSVVFHESREGYYNIETLIESMKTLTAIQMTPDLNDECLKKFKEDFLKDFIDYIPTKEVKEKAKKIFNIIKKYSYDNICDSVLKEEIIGFLGIDEELSDYQIMPTLKIKLECLKEEKKMIYKNLNNIKEYKMKIKNMNNPKLIKEINEVKEKINDCLIKNEEIKKIKIK